MINVQPNCKIVKTKVRQQITDLDSICYPDRSYVNYDKYMKYPNEAAVTNCIALQGTRGCPYGCAYCHKIWPRSHVFRSAENIIEEIEIYYNMGIKRFAFIDDIFNLNRENSSRFFETILKKNMKVNIFFPNGTRGDILDKDFIDLMVEAGTVYIPMALETASERIQKIIRKNLNIDRVYENMNYLCNKYPEVMSALFFMIGFPSETEEEAMETLNFVKSIKWVHFPELHALTIYHGTEMEKIALEHGITQEMINANESNAFHDVPTTLPFKNKSFIYKYRAQFLKDYWMNKERIKVVLPGQMKYMTEKEITLLYNSYLNTKFTTIDDILKFMRIDKSEFKGDKCLNEKEVKVENLNKKINQHFVKVKPLPNAFRMLFLDATHLFSDGEEQAFTRFAEPPLGHMYLATNLKAKFGENVECKVKKSFVDFDSIEELKQIIDDFKPDLIGFRAMTIYKDFFHSIVAQVREWHPDTPIIAGGPHPTSSYQEVIQDTNIDVVLVGEGEETLGELVEKMMENQKKLPSEEVLKDIESICFRTKEDGE